MFMSTQRDIDKVALESINNDIRKTGSSSVYRTNLQQGVLVEAPKQVMAVAKPLRLLLEAPGSFQEHDLDRPSRLFDEQLQRHPEHHRVAPQRDHLSHEGHPR